MFIICGCFFLLGFVLRNCLLYLNCCSSRCRDNYIEMYDSFSTNGYHTGRHCGSLRNYVITSITSYAYVHYHTDAQNSTSGLHGFTAKVEAFDTDECRWPAADSCSHTCNNLPGSFECFCPDGYFLSSNGQVCFGRFVIGLLSTAVV